MDEGGPRYVTSTWLDGYEKFIESFLQDAQVVFYKQGDVMIRQDEPVDRLYLVLRGTVEVSYTNEEGQTKIAAIIHRGALSGVAGLNRYWGHHTHTCRTPAMAAVLPKEAVYQWDSEMLLTLIRMQTRKMELAFQQLKENSTVSVRDRLVRLLLERGRMERLLLPVELPVRFPFQKQELANLIGSTRERVGQVLRELQDEGLVEVEGKEICFYLSALQKGREGGAQESGFPKDV